MINYRDAWNYRLQGTLPKTPKEGAICIHSKQGEGSSLFAQEVPRCTNFLWVLIWELEVFREGEEEKKGNTQLWVLGFRQASVTFEPRLSPGMPQQPSAPFAELFQVTHTLQDCSSQSFKALGHDLYPAHSLSAREVPYMIWPFIFSFFPHLPCLPKATPTKPKLKSPAERQSVFAELKLCHGALTQLPHRHWFSSTAQDRSSLR